MQETVQIGCIRCGHIAYVVPGLNFQESPCSSCGATALRYATAKAERIDAEFRAAAAAQVEETEHARRRVFLEAAIGEILDGLGEPPKALRSALVAAFVAGVGKLVAVDAAFPASRETQVSIAVDALDLVVAEATAADEAGSVDEAFDGGEFSGPLRAASFEQEMEQGMARIAARFGLAPAALEDAYHLAMNG